MRATKPRFGPSHLATVKPEWRDYWRGLVAAVPVVEGPNGPYVSELLTGLQSTAGDTVPSNRWFLDPPGHWGWIINGQLSVIKVNWATHPQWDRITSGGSATFMGRLVYWNESSAGPVGIFGCLVGASRFGFYTGSTEAAEFRYGGVSATVATSQVGTGRRVWVGRHDGDGNLTMDLYDAVTGELQESASASGSVTPGTGGQLHVLGHPGSTDGGRFNFAGGYIWDRRLTDTEVQRLLADFWGPLQPATVQQVNPVASLLATGTQTIADVVNENDNTTDLHLSVDDDPASPSDSDWVNNEVEV